MSKNRIPNQTLIKYLAISVWALVATLMSATPTPAQKIELPTGQNPTSARMVPPEATACIPTSQIVSTELIGSSTYQGKTYYLIAAYNSGGFPSDLVIATSKDRCQRLHYNLSGESTSFPSNVPQPVATELNSQRPKRH